MWMGRDSDQDHAADFTGRTSFSILPFSRSASGGRDRAKQGATERQFLSARPIGQKAELPDAHKEIGRAHV